MKAVETTVKDLLEGDKLYVIPKYQRKYAWTKNDWAQFWRAIERHYGEAEVESSPHGHFLGSIVYAQRKSFATEASNFDVIDGQQRLTTVMLLLAAMRDSLEEDDPQREKIEAFFKNRFESSEFQFKVRPGDSDRPHFNSILSGNIEQSGGLVLSAYKYFLSAISELADTGPINFTSLLRAATARLEIVQIVTGPEDNAHRIFQTLNSTGKELTGVDLLRNHFFMLLPNELDDAYERYWNPMQSILGDRFTSFLWVDLVSRRGLESVPNKPDRIYAEWQAILDPISSDEPQVLSKLEELSQRAQNYVNMVEARTESEELDYQLARLRDWGVDVHHPLSFGIMEAWRARVADTSRAAQALRYVESFLVRRMLAGVPTNNLNRIFTTSVGQLHHTANSTEDIDEVVRRILSQPGKYWPSDEVLLRDGVVSPFYERQRASQRQFILRNIEEAMAAPYAPNWDACRFTIEHVLPQTLTTWWHEHLQEEGAGDPSQIHQEFRHTIGNLTLTCENPELGQMAFPEKCSIYENDGIKMNDDIAETSAWNRAAILSRGGHLIDCAIQLWPAPAPSEELDSFALATSVRTVLETLPPGRWVSLATIADFIDTDEVSIAQVLPLIRPQDLTAIVLDNEGYLLPEQTTATERQRALDLLIELGVIDNEDSLPAVMSACVTAAELESLASE